MKSALLEYHREFPQTPMSGWAGARWHAWLRAEDAGGQFRRPVRVSHPFLAQRKLWCLLSVEFDSVDLRFAMPPELDLFLDVMSQNPLPSGRALVPDQSIGRPNNHWLLRLPAQAKPNKFRQRLCAYLRAAPEVTEFRKFYQANPVQFDFPGYFQSASEAAFQVNEGERVL